jgi:hypothetical protein
MNDLDRGVGHLNKGKIESTGRKPHAIECAGAVERDGAGAGDSFLAVVVPKT